MTLGWEDSMMAQHELVVPRSIPTILKITKRLVRMMIDEYVFGDCRTKYLPERTAGLSHEGALESGSLRL